MAWTKINSGYGSQAIFNTASPAEYGGITTGIATRVPVGARLAGSVGYAMSLPNAVVASGFISHYNAAIVTGMFYSYFRFSSFDAFGTGSGNTTIMDMINALANDPPGGGPGGAVQVSNTGVLTIITSFARSAGTYQLALNTWYRIAVQFQRNSDPIGVYWVYVGPRDNSTPMVCVAQNVNVSPGTQFNYFGILNNGRGNSGATFVHSGMNLYQGTSAARINRTGTTTNGSAVISSINISTADMSVGDEITCVGFPVGTVVVTKNSTTQITVNNVCTGAGGASQMFGVFVAGEGPREPAGLLPPPAGPLTFILSDTASAGGDGTVANKLLWTEAATVAPIICPCVDGGVASNYVVASGGAAYDPTGDTEAQTYAKVLNGTIIPNPRLDTWTPDADINLTESSGTAQSLVLNHCIYNGAGHTINFMKAVTGFTQYDSVNYPHIWQANTAGNVAVLFEDNKFMDKIIGAAAASITGNGTLNGGSTTSIRALLNINRNVYWQDGSKFYFSTSDGANPSTHTYTRSAGTTLGSGLTGLFVSGLAYNFTIDGLIGYDPYGSTNGSWDFIYGDNAKDLSVAYDFAANGWGDHACGISSTASNATTVAYNYTVNAGPPSSYWNGHVPGAITMYTATTGTKTNQWLIDGVQAPKLMGVVGQDRNTGGAASAFITGLYAHNTSGISFKSATVENSNIGGQIGLVDVFTAVTITDVDSPSIQTNIATATLSGIAGTMTLVSGMLTITGTPGTLVKPTDVKSGVDIAGITGDGSIEAAQLATDTAAVDAGKDDINNTRTILGITGTQDLPALIASQQETDIAIVQAGIAGIIQESDGGPVFVFGDTTVVGSFDLTANEQGNYAAGQGDQLAADQTEVTTNAANILRVEDGGPATLLGLTNVGTLNLTAATEAAAANQLAADQTVVALNAGYILAHASGGPTDILTIAGTLRVVTGRITSRPTATSTSQYLILVRGNDYNVASGQPLEWTDTGGNWPDLTDASITLTIRQKDAGGDGSTIVLMKSGTVVSSSGSTKTVRVEPLNADTASLIPGDKVNRFDVQAVLATGERVTLVLGDNTVLEDETTG